MWVIAPDKFKGTLTAQQASNAIARGLRNFNIPFVEIPLGDGGDGTAELVARGEKMTELVLPGIQDAYGQPINVTCYRGTRDKSRCVAEVASVVGLANAKARGEINAMNASSAGVGELINRLLANGMSDITLCLGGSATSDGGAGCLQAMGAKFYIGEEEVKEPITPRVLGLVDRIDMSGTSSGGRLTMLCDVNVPLLGKKEGEMSAIDFARQKGVREKDMPALKSALENWVRLAGASPYEAMCGAAGGLGYGLKLAGWDEVELTQGAEYMIEQTGIREIENLEGVITGEGSVDRQSWTGKVVGALRNVCVEKDVPLIVIAGCVGEDVWDGIGGESGQEPPGTEITIIDSSYGNAEKLPPNAEEAMRRVTEAARQAGDIIRTMS